LPYSRDEIKELHTNAHGVLLFREPISQGAHTRI
jgi:hypothetical protein